MANEEPELRMTAEETLALLRGLEWSAEGSFGDGPGRGCPECHRKPTQGHYRCALDRLIRQTEADVVASNRANANPTAAPARPRSTTYWCSEGCGFVDGSHRCEQWSKLTRVPPELQEALIAREALEAKS